MIIPRPGWVIFERMCLLSILEATLREPQAVANLQPKLSVVGWPFSTTLKLVYSFVKRIGIHHFIFLNTSIPEKIAPGNDIYSHNSYSHTSLKYNKVRLTQSS